MRNVRRILLASVLALGAMATAIAPRQQEAVPQTVDIVATATKAEGFKTFVALVDKAGLTANLKEPGPFTVLAPTDEAFEKLPKGVLQKVSDDPELLRKVLNYHVVKGLVASVDLKDGTETDTVQEEKIKIAVTDTTNPETNATEKSITLNDKKAKIVKADIKASNGLIHSIDTVLLPPSPAKPGSR